MNTIKAISVGASYLGAGLTAGIAGYEYATGQANTHTIVDLGVSALGFAAIGAAAILMAPEILVGAAAVGVVYGVASLGGLGQGIDNATNNWGRTLLYGR
jgi:hypothetical protein